MRIGRGSTTARSVSIGPSRVRVAPSRPPAASAVEATWEALRCVYDPELCVDVVSLGLVYAVREDNAGIHVDMTLTTPGCPAAESLPEMAREAIVGAVPPTTPVEVQIVWDPPWSPAMMNPEAAATLGLRDR